MHAVSHRVYKYMQSLYTRNQPKCLPNVRPSQHSTRHPCSHTTTAVQSVIGSLEDSGLSNCPTATEAKPGRCGGWDHATRLSPHSVVCSSCGRRTATARTTIVTHSVIRASSRNLGEDFAVRVELTTKGHTDSSIKRNSVPPIVSTHKKNDVIHYSSIIVVPPRT